MKLLEKAYQQNISLELFFFLDIAYGFLFKIRIIIPPDKSMFILDTFSRTLTSTFHHFRPSAGQVIAASLYSDKTE